MLHCERLTSEHITNFVSGNEQLDTWLRTAALTADRAGTARVRVWLDEEDQVAGYFAIAPHTIRSDELPAKVARGGPRTVPGFLLARLAIREQLQGRGYGAELLIAALSTTLDAIRAGGGRLIVVDAIDRHAYSFYEHFGFSPIPGNDDRLVIKASTAAASLEIPWP